VSAFVQRRSPQLLAAALCAGLAGSNALRSGSTPPLLLCAALVAGATIVDGHARLGSLALALALVGWWWGSMRLDGLDRSPLSVRAGTAESMRLVVTGPARSGLYDVSAPALVVMLGKLLAHEPVLLRVPKGRSPPQGGIVETVGQLGLPRSSSSGFDERVWLRRRGIHLVVRADRWRLVGRRGGVNGFADRLRQRLKSSIARGLRGDRAAVIEGVVLGEDSGLSGSLRQRFRASGLYHLLAVSGQNVALVAAGAVGLVWVLGLSRLLGQLAALAAIASYVLAVGAQPSVVRAGVAGALASVAWLSARATDRWHMLLVGAIVLLAWNPYNLLDVGFQLSFAAVVSIFVLVPRFERFLEGYPLGRLLRLVVAVSAACGLATAPIAWLQFHSIQVLTVPANALAAPAAAPLLGLGLAAAAIAPFSASAAAALAWVNGWCAAYLITVARFIGGLPGAQIRSTRALLVLLAGALLVAAYASRCRGVQPSSAPRS
jgi:competence protein ComEC